MAATVASGDVRVPSGDLKLESGDLRISGQAKGIVFPDSSVQTTAAPSGLKTILNGAGNPLAQTGTVGDFYINTTSNTLFGPKGANGWPTPGVSLVGPQGATGLTGATGLQGPQGVPGPAGATGLTGANGLQGSQGQTGAAGTNGIDGKTVLNGAVDPTAEGANGDFYINTASNKLFGPKADGIWPAGVSLVGPIGATGLQGAQGVAGPTGQTGLTGATGSIGPQGQTGTAGTNGIDGKSMHNGVIDPTTEGANGDFYINIASNKLFGPKAAGIWTAGVSLVGPTGATGAIGPQGQQGLQGIQGVAGPIGSTGLTGLTGAAGTNGVDGKTLLSGTSDPAAGSGNNGDFYINTASNKLFGPKAGGIWLAGVSLVGPQGAAGANYTLPKAPVLATGQQTTYAEGDDGNWKSGAVVTGPRFTDNLVNGVTNGTVTDNLTGLIWLKDAGCFATLGGITKGTTPVNGFLTWANALTWTNNLVGNNTACSLNDGSTAGQWRLPNRKELMSLVDRSTYNPALPGGHPFSNVQSSFYWSGSTYSSGTAFAWVVGVSDGVVHSSSKASDNYVWPVRAGQ